MRLFDIFGPERTICMFKFTFDVLWCVGCTFADHYPSSSAFNNSLCVCCITQRHAAVGQSRMVYFPAGSAPFTGCTIFGKWRTGDPVSGIFHLLRVSFKRQFCKWYFSPLNVENWRRMFDLRVFKQCTRDSWRYCCVVMSVFWCFSARGVGEGTLPFADVIWSRL